jgi:hypothetical protein
MKRNSQNKHITANEVHGGFLDVTNEIKDLLPEDTVIHLFSENDKEPVQVKFNKTGSTPFLFGLRDIYCRKKISPGQIIKIEYHENNTIYMNVSD